ncbi:MAG: VOC family protein, partial [Cyanobacteria bacterium J06559_3]
FSWSELITSDVEGARAFYGQLFGWTLKDGPVAGMPYTVIEVDGEDIGGMAPPPPNQANMPPTWGIYITVEDVDAIAAKAKALGGEVLLPPMSVESVGKFSLIKDPQGATFCAIQYSQ